MRGNLERKYGLPFADGSIPAYAGEPRDVLAGRYVAVVYPRVCGGTLTQTDRNPFCNGLSPRMRGNRVALTEGNGITRSIPAYAGEPRFPTAVRSMSGVYPRVCGGTMP